MPLPQINRLRHVRHRLRVRAEQEALKRAGRLLNKTVVGLDYAPNATNVPRYNSAPLPTLTDRVASGVDRYRHSLQMIAAYADDLAQIPLHGHGIQPSWINTMLPGLDSAAIYAFVRNRRPHRYVEVGSGNSTKFAAQARADAGLETHFTSIDPSPRAEIDKLCDEVIRKPLESADLSVFDGLQQGDILFMDGSHRVFMNNDVSVFFLEVLPVLPPGVLVAVHDVFLPFDYPDAFADRYYSEQYILAAWLLGQPAAEIIFPAFFVSREMRDDVSALWALSPRFETIEHHGGAFWLETR